MKSFLAVLLTVASCFGFQTNYSVTTEKLWDFTGEYAADDGELSQVIQLSHQANGAVFGSYEEDYETPDLTASGNGSLVGKVVKAPTGLAIKLKVDFAGNGHFASGNPVSLTFVGGGSLNFANHSLFGVFKGRGCNTQRSQTQCATRTISIDDYELAAQMTGAWTLALDVATNGNQIVGNATVTLSNGRALTFVVSGHKSATKCAMRLAGNGDAIGTKLSVTTDPSFRLTKATGRLLGQTIKVLR